MASSPYGPRAVPPSSWWPWVKEAFSLVTARWWWHVPLALVTALAATELPALIEGLLALLALGVSGTLAAASSLGRPPLAALRLVLPRLLAQLAVLGVVWLAFVLLLTVALPPGLGGVPPAPDGSTVGLASGTRFVPGAEMLQLPALIVVWPAGLFLVGLVCWTEAPLVIKLMLAWQALALNRFCLLLGVGAAVVMLGAAAWSGLTSVLTLPLSGALAWVMHRHVFMGQAPGAAAVARESAPSMKNLKSVDSQTSRRPWPPRSSHSRARRQGDRVHRGIVGQCIGAGGRLAPLAPAPKGPQRDDHGNKGQAQRGAVDGPHPLRPRIHHGFILGGGAMPRIPLSRAIDAARRMRTLHDIQLRNVC